MTAHRIAALLITLAIATAAAQVSNPKQTGRGSTTPSSPAAPRHHGIFTVELVKSLDSRKLKSGDSVEATLTSGITLPDGSTVPRGAKIIGHITEAKARSKSENESSLGISFDKIAAPSGDVPIHGVIQALAPNPNEEVTAGSIEYNDLGKGGVTDPPLNTSHGPTPLLNETSVGVLGIKNLQLDPKGVLTSTSKEVKLNSGTRILLNVMMQ